MSQSLTEFRVQKKFQLRLYQFTGFVVVVLLIYIVQLGNLQLLNGHENRLLAKKFVSRQEFTVAPRGLIFDRNAGNGVDPLVKNINYIDFVIYPSRFKNREEGVEYIRTFANVMGRPISEYADAIEPDSWKKMVRKNESLILITRMTRREHERLAELRILSSKGEFATNHLRYYGMGPAMAHVTGYIGLPSRKELNRFSVQPYQYIGKGGLEARYDNELRGTDGIKIRHRIIDSEEQITRSEQGNNLILTIDRDMQAAAYRSITRMNMRGAVVAINANTGEILTLVSNPSFDPNILSSGTIEQIRDHYGRVQENQGFLNIAMQAKFPPASTFKPLVAIAALEDQEDPDIGEDTTYSCSGHWELQSTVPGVPASRYWCWRPGGHGRQDMISAIANSCSVYFYQLGYRIGPSQIIHYARAFGLDQETGIDLPGEITGFVPDQRWKQIQWSSQWFDGDTVNLSIGQGFMETTPLEVAVLYSALANGGKIYRPHILKEVRDPDTNRLIRSVQPTLIKEIPINRKSIDIVQRGMREGVLRGTSGMLRRLKVPAAGKTGTAQTKSKTEGRNHAWWAGFAPFGIPDADPIVIVVFVEFGRGGAATAVPIAYDLFRTAFADYVVPDHLNIEAMTRMGMRRKIRAENEKPEQDSHAGSAEH